MSELTMPVTETNSTLEKDQQSYEFAFHVLPTVAEGEVAKVFETLKDHIIKVGGEIFAEEAPERFDLAYEIIKHLEGKNRKFSSAYFGWVRFRLTSDKLEELTEKIDETKELIRYLLIKLTRVEEQNNFNFHESISRRKVETVGEEENDEDKNEEDIVTADEEIDSIADEVLDEINEDSEEVK